MGWCLAPTRKEESIMINQNIAGKADMVSVNVRGIKFSTIFAFILLI
jgi:hypothetical protein